MPQVLTSASPAAMPAPASLELANRNTTGCTTKNIEAVRVKPISAIIGGV